MDKKALAEFVADLWRDTVALLSGVASVLLWLVTAVWHEAPPAAHWSFWTLGAAALLVAAFRVWKRQYDARLALDERLRPRLEIGSATQTSDWRLRVMVRNLSQRTIRFGVNLVGITPSVGYPLPAPLLLTHTEPHQQREIPGEGSYLVDVAAEVFAQTVGGDVSWVELMVMGNPPRAVRLDAGRYEITICAYPISGEEGMSVYRRFYIIPQTGGRYILSDAGPYGTKKE